MSETPNTVVFLPCCMTKCDNGRRPGDGFNFAEPDLPNTLNNLQEARRELNENRHVIVTGSTPTSSLHLYDGRIFGPLREEKDNILTTIDNGQIRLFIISAGYGIVDAREKIKDYDATMKSKTARLWCDAGLIGIIKDLLLKAKPKRVFGYFTGKPDWNPNQASAYRHFFTQGLESACNAGLDCEIAGCFYGKGLAGLTALGNCLLKHYRQKFSTEFAEEVEENGYTHRNTIIKFDRICHA